MSNPWPMGCMRRRMATNVAQHKIVNLLEPFFCSSVSVCAFNVWPKTTLLLTVWPRDTKKLDTPGRERSSKVFFFLIDCEVIVLKLICVVVNRQITNIEKTVIEGRLQVAHKISSHFVSGDTF